MLKFGNKEFRNLQEQVLKNMQNIANIQEGTAVLSEFGIKVVGEVDSLQDLPSVTEYKSAHEDWEYGDAFAIGTEPPYTLVILTRANDDITDDHWFDIGDFPAPGPQGATGPQGEVGPQGPQGNQGIAGADAGFGLISATAQTLSAGSSATATVTASGPDTAKEFSFTFGIPRGQDGSQASWGNIQGTLSDQTDLQDALNDKQDELVSGTNIKTINNESILGSGDIVISANYTAGTGIDITNNAISVDTSVIAEVSDLANYLPTSGGTLTGNLGAPNNSISAKTLMAHGNTSNKSITVEKDGFTVKTDLLSSHKVTMPSRAGQLALTSEIPDEVSGTHDSTNWTSLTIGTSTYSIPQGGTTSVAWGSITGTLSSQTDLQSALDAKQDVIDSSHKLSASLVDGLSTVATTGDYNDLTNKPTLFDGDYDSLTNKPDLSIYETKSEAFSGDYNDLTNKPTIPTKTSDLTNDSGFITSSSLSGYATESWVTNQGYLTTVSWSGVTDKPSFATVATTGSYADLSGTPDLSIYATTSSLSQVATTGSYSDLSGTPTIPDAVSGTNDGTNWTSLTIGASTYSIPQGGSGTVSDVTFNNTSIVSNGVANLNNYALKTINTLGDASNNRCLIEKTAADELYINPTHYNIMLPVNSNNYMVHPTYGTIEPKMVYVAGVDGNLGGIVYGSIRYYQTVTVGSTEYYPIYYFYQQVGSISWNNITGKPTFATVATTGSYSDLSGTPDLSIYATISSLASIATTGSYSDLVGAPDLSIYATISSLATVATTGAYSDLTGTPTIPTSTSQLTNDSGFITSSSLSGYATEAWVGQQGYLTSITSSMVTSALGYTPGTSNFSGDYDDLTDKPTIPTDTSDLTNGAGFITGINSTDVTTALGFTPLANTACTYQTTEPTAAIADGGVHIVYLSAEPTTKYSGYIYMIAEA